jgi:hypothetical protein
MTTPRWGGPNKHQLLVEELILVSYVANVLWSDVPCRLWVGAHNAAGYGLVRTSENHLVYVHRTAFEVYHKRPLQNGLFVLHRCDNPACYEPIHLWEGTAKDNIQDCLKKGRHKVERGDQSSARRRPECLCRGSKSPFAKLTEADVIEIRRVYAESRIGTPALGKQYGVSGQTIYSIVCNNSWRHLCT